MLMEFKQGVQLPQNTPTLKLDWSSQMLSGSAWDEGDGCDLSSTCPALAG